MTLVLDLSNYDASTFDPACMLSEGVAAIILGCQREDIADQMAAKAQAAGLPIIATYAFLYFGQDTLGQTMAAVRISKRYGIPRVFLDCESGEGTERPGITVAERQAELRDCIHAVTTEGLAAGIYSGAFWWPSHMGNTTEWAHLPLWHAAYYNDGSRQRNVAYGGWSECAIHQWTSTLDVCGRRRDANEVWDTSLMEVGMTRTEYEDLLIGIYSGAEEKDLPRDQRLTNALYRQSEIVNGNAASVNDRAASAIKLATTGGGGNAVAPHKHVPGGVL